MTIRAFAVLAAIAVLPITASVGHAAPKPWQWTPAKVSKRLQATSPIAPSDVGSSVLSASCAGRGKGVLGRYTRFLCQTRWGGPNGSYTSAISVRVLPIGTGKLCVVTGSDGRSLPTPGPMILPARACP